MQYADLSSKCPERIGGCKASFPALEHPRPLSLSKLYFFVTGVNCHAPLESIGGLVISIFYAIEFVGRYTTESVTHDESGYFTFAAIQHHCPLAGTKLYCLVTETHVCEQLAQGRYMKVEWLRVKPTTC